MTTKAARRALAILIASWLVDPPASFVLDDDLIEVYGYTTAPDPNNTKPFQIVVGTERATVKSEGLAESLAGANLYVALFARVNVDDEATKEAAEDWLDDCEQYLASQIEHSRNTAHWTRIKINAVRRDPDSQWFKFYRVSYIRIGVELR